MLEYIFAGAGLRLFQIIIYSSIWIAIGCFVAAVFRRMLGPEKLRLVFGNGTRWGLLAGWLMGMLLPVCSLGVIPIVRELHRARVKQGTIIAFGLTAPLFNPMSVLYGLTLSDPLAILAFSFCALVIVSILGYAWDRWLEVEETVPLQDPLPTPGIRRSLAVLFSTCKEIVSANLVYILIGIIASAALAIAIPKGFLQNQVERDNLFAPTMVALIATPIYTTPLLAMSQIGGMFQHGNSIGAGFSLLILGAGANVGLLAWMGMTFGFRRMFIFFGLLAGSTILLAHAIDRPLIPEGVEPAGHTHAFDVYTHPFAIGQPDYLASAKTQAADFWGGNEFGGTYLLGIMIFVGIALMFVERNVDLEKWYTEGADAEAELEPSSRSLDIVLPGWFLGAVTVVGLIAISVLGCYLYYPASNELFADLDIINTECVLSSKTGDWDAADKWILYADDLSRRLEVGVFLRQGAVDEFVAAKAKNYREELDILKAMVDSRDQVQCGPQGMKVQNSYRRLKDAFKEE